MTAWTKFDSVLVGILIVSVMFSAVKGFTRELVSLGALIWGFLLACWFYPTVARATLPMARTSDIASITAFLGIIIVAMIAGGFLARYAGKLVDKAGMRFFDRWLGAAFGLLRGAVICSILVLAMLSFSVGADRVTRSRLAPYLIRGARVMVTVAPQEMRDRFQKGVERARQTWSAQP